MATLEGYIRREHYVVLVSSLISIDCWFAVVCRFKYILLMSGYRTKLGHLR